MMRRLLVFFLTGFFVNQLLAQAPPAPQQFNVNQGLRFEENKGQVANTDGEVQNDILFTMKDKGMTLYFRQDGISYQWSYIEELPEAPYAVSEATGLPMNENEDPLHPLERGRGEVKPTTLHTYRVDMQWLGASKEVEIISEQAFEDYNNYYLAHCPDGVLNVKSYAKLIYKNIYPNVDVQYYVKDGKLKYDVLVHSNGDVSKVKFKYAGAQPKLIEGKIRLETPLGFLEEQTPVAWDGDSTLVNVKYKVKDRVVNFSLDAVKPGTLVIDPGLVWATYYGGSKIENASAIITDASDNVYFGGDTESSFGYRLWWIPKHN